MEIDLQKLKELAERATPGEWQVDADASHIRIVTADGACAYPFWITPTPNKEANAAYIVAASPDVVLVLIEELERLKKEADWLAEILGIQEEPCVKHFFDNVDCGAVTGCKECWREAARKAMESNHADTK